MPKLTEISLHPYNALRSDLVLQPKKLQNAQGLASVLLSVQQASSEQHSDIN